MSVYKRGRYYSYSFVHRGTRIQCSTRQSDRRVARQMEAAHRTVLAKGQVGIEERKPAPTLKDFSKRFADYISTRCAEKPHTVEFYASKMARLLDFQPLATTRLDKIDEALIEAYVQWRRKKVSPATVNRELATLRRALRLAYSWKAIDRVPMIHLLPGERVREFVLSQEQERLYLEFAPQPMLDIATLILDTGLRVGEALGLEWRDVQLNPANGAKYGFVHIRDGKSRNAKRNIPLTLRVKSVLEARRASGALRVFTDGQGGLLSRFTVRDQHAGLRKMLRLPKDAVIHSLRHTALTRLGESGADAFTIMRIAGHSSVVVSQRYVHPSPASIEAAFDRLEALNRKAQKELLEGGGRTLTTNSTTLD